MNMEAVVSLTNNSKIFKPRRLSHFYFFYVIFCLSTYLALTEATTKKRRILGSDKTVTEHFKNKVRKQGKEYTLTKKLQLRNSIYRKLYKLNGCKVEA